MGHQGRTSGEALLAGPVAIPRIVPGPRVARRRSAVQTDRHWHCVGVSPPLPYHGSCLLSIFGKIAKLPSDGTAPYRAHGICWHASLAVFCNRTVEASNSLISNANLIGKVYFPTAYRPTATVVVALGGLPDQLCHFGRHDGLVSVRAELAESCFYQSLLGSRFLPALGPGLWITVAERQISRFPLRHSFRWFSSACMSLRSASAAMSIPAGVAARYTASTRWLA